MENVKDIRVVELFAGVGGFRKGLEDSSTSFKTIWANQWEPGKKLQYAFDCYIKHFGISKNHVNDDISKVKNQIPDHDLIVGGFPCQDYSVARTGAKGMEGKKGVLWWDINDIIRAKHPSYVLLENVDRLLKSPAAQRGRDFGIILRCLDDLGYAVEWRVINAADYGQAQRRRRVFILAYREGTPIYTQLSRCISPSDSDAYFDWISKWGFFAVPFQVIYKHNYHKISIGTVSGAEYTDLSLVSSEFKAPFYNGGVMINGQFYSEELEPINVDPITLGDIREDDHVDERFFLDGSLEKWKFLKGSKKIARIRPDGEPYYFSEGGMCFPDNLSLPSRTMLTSESSVNRSTHVIEDKITGRLRLLTPTECERLNGFPDGWTDTGMPEKFRYFVMGNALVVPIVSLIGKRLNEIF